MRPKRLPLNVGYADTPPVIKGGVLLLPGWLRSMFSPPNPGSHANARPYRHSRESGNPPPRPYRYSGANRGSGFRPTPE